MKPWLLSAVRYRLEYGTPYQDYHSPDLWGQTSRLTCDNCGPIFDLPLVDLGHRYYPSDPTEGCVRCPKCGFADVLRDREDMPRVMTGTRRKYTRGQS
jgi:hypothetical protein